jgi:hypothetical protein
LDHWKDHYLALLRGRLLHMPAAYDLQIRLILQVIDDVCLRMVLACLEKQDSVELIGVLALELSYTVQRAITIGVWALAYHGWGFPTVLPRQGVVALLDHLRSRGPAKMRDLQRRFSVSAKTCEAVVDCLQREGLVIRHKREVKAMPLAGYLDILHRCPEFEQISQVSAVLLGESLESRGITRKNIKATRRAYEREWNAANKPLGKAEPCAGTVSEAADDTQPAENQMVNGEDAPSQG